MTTLTTLLAARARQPRSPPPPGAWPLDRRRPAAPGRRRRPRRPAARRPDRAPAAPRHLRPDPGHRWPRLRRLGVDRLAGPPARPRRRSTTPPATRCSPGCRWPAPTSPPVAGRRCTRATPTTRCQQLGRAAVARAVVEQPAAVRGHGRLLVQPPERHLPVQRRLGQPRRLRPHGHPQARPRPVRRHAQGQRPAPGDADLPGQPVVDQGPAERELRPRADGAAHRRHDLHRGRRAGTPPGCSPASPSTSAGHATRTTPTKHATGAGHRPRLQPRQRHRRPAARRPRWRSLDYLARHPATAERIATKLCVRFVADDAAGRAGRQAGARSTWTTSTAIAPVLRALFTSPEFAAAVGPEGPHAVRGPGRHRPHARPRPGADRHRRHCDALYNCLVDAGQRADALEPAERLPGRRGRVGVAVRRSWCAGTPTSTSPPAGTPSSSSGPRAAQAPRAGRCPPRTARWSTRWPAG